MNLFRTYPREPAAGNYLHLIHPPSRPPSLIFLLSTHTPVSHSTQRQTAIHRSSTRLQLWKGWGLGGGNNSTASQRAEEDEEDDEEDDGDSQDLLGEEGEDEDTIIIEGIDDDDDSDNDLCNDHEDSDDDEVEDVRAAVAAIRNSAAAASTSEPDDEVALPSSSAAPSSSSSSFSSSSFSMNQPLAATTTTLKSGGSSGSSSSSSSSSSSGKPVQMMTEKGMAQLDDSSSFDGFEGFHGRRVSYSSQPKARHNIVFEIWRQRTPEDVAILYKGQHQYSASRRVQEAINEQVSTLLGEPRMRLTPKFHPSLISFLPSPPSQLALFFITPLFILPLSLPSRPLTPSQACSCVSPISNPACRSRVGSLQTYFLSSSCSATCSQMQTKSSRPRAV